MLELVVELAVELVVGLVVVVTEAELVDFATVVVGAPTIVVTVVVGALTSVVTVGRVV